MLIFLCIIYLYQIVNDMNMLKALEIYRSTVFEKSETLDADELLKRINKGISFL